MKKQIFLLGIILFSLKLSSYAQSADSVKKQFIIRCVGTLNTKKPLIILDGALYKGDLDQINPADISTVNILKDSAAIALYGFRGNGDAVLLTTKHYKTDTLKIKPDTSIRFRDAIDHPKNSLLVIDDKTYDDSLPTKVLENTNPSSILEVSVLKGPTASAIYGIRAINGAVIITTMQYGTQVYELKFSAFSKKYKSYLNKNNNDDSKLTYVVNGVVVEREPTDKFMTTLYDIPKLKIKTIIFMEKYYKKTFSNPNPIVVIATEK